MPPPPVPHVQARLWLAAALVGLAAGSLYWQVQGATFARNETMVTTAYTVMIFFAVSACVALFRKELIAGAIIVLTLVATHYFSLEKPPWFLFDEVVWGVTPPALLALWQLAHARHRATALTYVGAGLWVAGFATKFLYAHQWRL